MGVGRHPAPTGGWSPNTSNNHNGGPATESGGHPPEGPGVPELAAIVPEMEQGDARLARSSGSCSRSVVEGPIGYGPLFRLGDREPLYL